MESIKNILVLVEAQDGKVRQVLASEEAKEASLKILQKNGVLKVDQEIIPIKIT